MSNLVIVESPAKAATIKSYLGSGYKVVASKGHIRDLPKSSLGIDVDNGFEPHYINIRGKGDIIKELKREAKSAKKIFLATDPDREGEAISWHIASQLGIPADAQCRVTFNEITKNAVKEAIKNPRRINEALVNSQQARRILDRLVGFKLSEVLWKNVKSGLSGGRVQSVAARIITEREDEIAAFVPREYWTIEAELVSDSGERINGRFHGSTKKKMRLSDEAAAAKVENAVNSGEFRVSSVRHAVKHRLPAPPFTTSTMLQEASRRLGYQSHRIMMIAQELYDGLNLGSDFGGVQGLITYMRTDSIRISDSAAESCADFIRENYGSEYLQGKKREYKVDANAQDAHEAIRPSNVYITPKAVKKHLTNEQFKLYELIWERFVASQMASAVLDTVNVDIECSGYVFKTGGYIIRSKGFLTVSRDDESNEGKDGEGVNLSKLPDVVEGQVLQAESVVKQQHFTEPPARYTEASLIDFLKENGIGRPSTYAPIIQIITSRQYVKRDKKQLVATPLGTVTTNFMKKYFNEIIDYEFTASMESKLDSIENGENTIEGVLSEFYSSFKVSLDRAMNSSDDSFRIAVPDEESDVICQLCGAKMVYKTGRYGKFLACPNFPECKNTATLDKDGNPQARDQASPELAGFKCELCGGEMVVRNGRYGAFYACINYPRCKFSKQKATPLGINCPKCGAEIVARRAKGRSVYYSCDKYPECSFTSWDMPLSERCPVCNDMLYYKKNRKSVICKNPSCDYSREEELSVVE